MQYDHDGTPLFDDLDAATAALENPDLSRDDRLAAELAVSAMKSGYTAEELDGYETISQGQADDLKHETADGLRFWLSRTGTADGEPYENTITIEREVEGRWINAAKYDGGELPDEEDEIAQTLIYECQKDLGGCGHHWQAQDGGDVFLPCPACGAAAGAVI